YHNREVLQGLLGYSAARYHELERTGIISDWPTKLRSTSYLTRDERVRCDRLASYDPCFKEKLGIQE
ncbi:MAG: hypothetical protein HYZ81_20345, partial [Nitrospinae bacterium]|nr:hypothetical protein [Nitrospinota bacterium]